MNNNKKNTHSGVIANSTSSSNNTINSNIAAVIENNSSLTNNSLINGITTINELTVSEMPLSSLSLTRNNNNEHDVIVNNDGISNKPNNHNVPSTHIDAIIKENITKMPAITIETTMPTKIDIIQMTTKASLVDVEITKRMQTTEFIGSSNTQRDIASTTSTEPITTNKPRKYILNPFRFCFIFTTKKKFLFFWRFFCWCLCVRDMFHYNVTKNQIKLKFILYPSEWRRLSQIYEYSMSLSQYQKSDFSRIKIETRNRRKCYTLFRFP